MPDIGDDAAATDAFFLTLALRNSHQSANIAPMNATGKCLFCDTPVGAERRWCDADCRDLWERERR